MNDDQVADLKQFITVTVSQQVTQNITELETRLNARFDGVDMRFAAIDARFDSIDARFAAIDSRFDSLERHLKSGFRSIADAIDRQNDQQENHEQRLTKLEQKAA